MLLQFSASLLNSPLMSWGSMLKLGFLSLEKNLLFDTELLLEFSYPLELLAMIRSELEFEDVKLLV